MTEKNQILVQQFVLSLSVSVSQVGFRKGGVDILGRRTQLEVLLSVLLLAALLALLACLLVLGLGFSSGNDTCLHLHRPPVPRVLLHPTVPFLLHRLFLFPASPFLSYSTFPSLPLLSFPASPCFIVCFLSAPFLPSPILPHLLLPSPVVPPFAPTVFPSPPLLSSLLFSFPSLSSFNSLRSSLLLFPLSLPFLPPPFLL